MLSKIHFILMWYGILSILISFIGLLYVGLLLLIRHMLSLNDDLFNILSYPLLITSWIPFFPYSIFVGWAIGSIYMALMFGSNGDFGRDDSDGI